VSRQGTRLQRTYLLILYTDLYTGAPGAAPKTYLRYEVIDNLEVLHAAR
jgi:hypothetical protein